MSKQDLKEIKTAVKRLILETLDIEDVGVDEIQDDMSLLSGENALTIDSIDVLEVVVAIQRKFMVKIRDQNHARLVVNSVNTIAEFIQSQQEA